jgi:hypothetical protein
VELQQAFKAKVNHCRVLHYDENYSTLGIPRVGMESETGWLNIEEEKGLGVLNQKRGSLALCVLLCQMGNLN